jgi:hypothetical protein
MGRADSRRRFFAMALWRSAALALALCGPSTGVAAQTPLCEDEIVAKHLDAVGGATRLRALKSLRRTGRITLEAGDKVLEGPFVVETKRTRKSRMAAELNGLPTSQAFDGVVAWGMPLGKSTPEIVDPEQTRDREVESEFDEWLLDHKARGITIVSIDRERIGATDAIKLRLAFKGQQMLTYLDPATYVEIRRDHLSPDGTVRDETYLSDQREVGGLLFPTLVEITSVASGLKTSLRVLTIELDADIPDARFEMPKKAGPHAAKR